jgi:hypothetical protein
MAVKATRTTSHPYGIVPGSTGNSQKPKVVKKPGNKK